MADMQDIVVVLLILGLAAVLIFEVRYLRSRKKGKGAQKLLPDKAHNTLSTTKAIVQLVSSRGGDVTEAADLIEQSDAALKRGNYRVSLELADRAKVSLRAVLSRLESADSAGSQEADAPDAAALEEAPLVEAAPPEEERTAKEILHEEFPEHYVQSRFALNTAREELTGADPVSEGRTLLGRAEEAFEREDYGAALSLALRAQNARTVEPEEVAPVLAFTCSDCGAPLNDGDQFCRKCGAILETASTCPDCGIEAKADDAFCRGCGTTLA